MPVTADSRRAGMLVECRRDQLAREVVERHYASEPEAWQKYGREGWRKAFEDARFHFAYLAEALKQGEPCIFTDYAGWARTLFHHLRLPENLMERSLHFMLEALAGTLAEEDLVVVAEVLDSAQTAAAPLPEEPFVNDADPFAELAHSYLDLLLDARRKEAIGLLTDAVENGTAIKDLYLRILQPVMRETGRLWHTNRLDVDQEHYISATTETVMSLVYPNVRAEVRKDLHVVAACTQNELHQIGLRMVSDFFEMDGWRAYCVGANVPEESLVRAVTLQQADVLALSITMTYNLTPLERIIERVRQSEVSERIRIIVGGFPFLAFPGLWEKVGADGYAPDARAAVELADQLVNSPLQDDSRAAR